MAPVGLAALCVLLAQVGAAAASPQGVVRAPTADPSAAVGAPAPTSRLAAQLAAPSARDGIARVALAEAGNQGDSGLAAVVYTILNRLQDGRWGDTVDSVLNARHQFEPVMRAGGDWRALPTVSAAAKARIDTILNLVLDGRLPDLTNGARYFQNPSIVADRARAGQVSPGLVDFGGATPSAHIGAHRFYVAPGGAGAARAGVGRGARPGLSAATLFVGENRAADSAGDAAPVTNPPTSESAVRPAPGDPAKALFVPPSATAGAPRP